MCAPATRCTLKHIKVTIWNKDYFPSRSLPGTWEADAPCLEPRKYSVVEGRGWAYLPLVITACMYGPWSLSVYWVFSTAAAGSCCCTCYLSVILLFVSFLYTDLVITAAAGSFRYYLCFPPASLCLVVLLHTVVFYTTAVLFLFLLIWIACISESWSLHCESLCIAAPFSSPYSYTSAF